MDDDLSVSRPMSSPPADEGRQRPGAGRKAKPKPTKRAPRAPAPPAPPKVEPPHEGQLDVLA